MSGGYKYVNLEAYAEQLKAEVERLRKVVARARQHAQDTGDEQLWALLYVPKLRQRLGETEHAPDCFWLRANPSVDGDEGACCSCGAYADAAHASTQNQEHTDA
jgi:hypothetical protein